MLFALLLFLLYFAVGTLFVLTLWAVQIRFGDVSDLDPESRMVRLFRRRHPDSPRVAANGGVSTTAAEHRRHEQLLDEMNALLQQARAARTTGSAVELTHKLGGLILADEEETSTVHDEEEVQHQFHRLASKFVN